MLVIVVAIFIIYVGVGVGGVVEVIGVVVIYMDR